MDFVMVGLNLGFSPLIVVKSSNIGGAQAPSAPPLQRPHCLGLLVALRSNKISGYWWGSSTPYYYLTAPLEYGAKQFSSNSGESYESI